MPNGSISFNPSRASTSNIPTCAVTGSRNICSIGSKWTTLQNTTQRHNSTNLTGSPRDGLPTISAAPRGRRGSAELVTHERLELLKNAMSGGGVRLKLQFLQALRVRLSDRHVTNCQKSHLSAPGYLSMALMPLRGVVHGH